MKWSDEDDAKLLGLASCGDWEKVSGAFDGRSADACRFRHSRLCKDGVDLAAHGFDPDEWEVRDAWIKGKFVTAKVRRKAIDWKQVLASLKPDRKRKAQTLAKPNGRMLEVAEVDAHYGKLSWEPESGADYDLKIADECHREATLDFAARLGKEKFDRVLLLGNQDSIHISNPAGTIHAGIPVDYDSRFQKIVKCRIEYDIWRVLHWLKRGRVTFVSTPGNHGYIPEMLLTEVLRAWFKDCPDVDFMDAPADRQYMRWGKVGLGFAHGDKTKANKSAMLFAAEASEIWGLTEFREFHTGHYHAETVTTYPGCTHRVLKALCPADKWHADLGFVALPGSQAFVWDREKGLDFTLNRHG